MPAIYDIPPFEVQENLNALNFDLSAKIPAKKLDQNLLIATWNIRHFGSLTRKWYSESDDSPKRDLSAILCIAAILKRFDIIAIQEVKSNLRALRDTLKVLGSHWSLILTDVTRGNPGNDERIAFIFDTRRVQLSGLACELVIPEDWVDEISDNALKKQFARTPYAVSFKSNHKTFILVTLHILYGKKVSERIPELKAIARWLSEWTNNLNAYHQDMIVLGDFNIDERSDLLDKTFLSEGLYVPPQLQDNSVTRSIFNETKYYDQIGWFRDATANSNLSMNFSSGGNYNFLPYALSNRGLSKRSLSYILSDHYPLWAEFQID
ncbi:endonuclease/exonuclease/phosphatase family protein [Leeuwenhoekiella aestuarii]|uniref:Endonuclease/exonuclease/phosphatase family protein n=1 Tax=Leeuwenhoekiella aestuarii TaxID=2249426 RepID=A0A4Q0NQ31_9FLAO|nr:endonuclease/exonuclease/phosphatase family protein [Leeuwenhoekiella aestuarii]RXG12532.1 endonuclease/exonuclease/phosphatase family protein [Leeuwenhoekiella aestuarii]RXG14479.1 endonuclease/exonuclease/phosphatase family protein [Leeuwenhoekiella aestuarii]